MATKSPTYTQGNTRTSASGVVTKLPDRVKTSTGSRSYGSNEAEQDMYASGSAPGQPLASPTEVAEAPKDPLMEKAAGMLSPQAPATNAQLPSAELPFDQANKNLQSGGLQGQALTNATNSLKQKYNQGLQIANSSGQAQQGMGLGMAQAGKIIEGITPEAETPSIVGELMDFDSNFDSILTDFDEFMSPVSQKTSLVEEYQKLLKTSGIEGINEELIDAKRIIDGTEDDIRAEITATGGFGTESQVQALANARNKSLIKNYNALLDTRDNAMQQMNTMMQLSIQDRQSAEAEFDRKLNFAFKVQEFKQKAIDNSRSQLNAVVSAVGYKGLLASTAGDPYQVSLIEKTLGIGSGGLSNLASIRDEEQELNLAIKREQLADLQKAPGVETDIIEMSDGRQLLINAKTGETIKEIGAGAGTSNELSTAYSKSNIETIDGLKESSGLNNAVGSGFKWFSRVNTPFTGAKANFIADVEKMTSQLTLENLVNAKAKGATFGALSEGEMRVLESSASKIGTWRQEKDGKVLGYKASQKDFKKELDSIGNFAKLDYILKGGNPADVGVQQMSNGKLIVQNSDGTFTELR